MSENKSCCPFCNSIFTPTGGTAEEYLARGIITVFNELQIKGEYDGDCDDNLRICPRCGVTRMIPGVMRNALSREINCYVCSLCGTDEAVRVFADCVLPLSSWWVVKEILVVKKPKRISNFT
jgi:hypothetical protein